MRSWSGSAATGLLAALLLAFAGTASAAAQNVTRTRFGFGYVAQAPELMAGGAAYVIFPVAGGIGLYADAKFDASNPTRKSNYLADLTAQQVEDQFGDRFLYSTASWRSFDLAVMRPLRPSLTIYAGAGYARKREYKEYLDDTGTRGLAGHYWVEDTAARASTVNLMGGFFFRMSRFLNAQFGVESAPGGVTVGLSLALPPQ